MTTEAKVRPWLLIVLAVVVILGGGFTYWNLKGNKSIVSPTTSPTPTLSTAKKTPTASPSSSTADWQTYKNDTYGFSFKYPKDWTLGNDERNTPTFKSNADGTAQLLINFEGGFEDASFYRKGEVKNNLLNITTKEDWTKNGNSNQIVLYAVNITRNNDFLFLVYNYKDNKNNSAVNLFDTILSTFQFTK